MPRNQYYEDGEDIMDYIRRTNEAIVSRPDLIFEITRPNRTNESRMNTENDRIYDGPVEYDAETIDDEPVEYDAETIDDEPVEYDAEMIDDEPIDYEDETIGDAPVEYEDEPLDDEHIEHEADADEADSGEPRAQGWAEGEQRQANKWADLYEEMAARLRSEPGYAEDLQRHETEIHNFERRLERQAKRNAAAEAEQKAREEQGNRRRFRSRAEHAELPPPQWLVEGLIPENADVAIYAPFAALKTFVAIDLAMSVAMGCKALGTFPVAEAGPVFYWVGEGHDSFVKRRMTAWEIEHRLEPYSAPNIWAMDGVPVTTDNEMVEHDIRFAEEVLSERRDKLAEQGRDGSPCRAKLFVIDTMNRALNGQDEDKSHVASRYLQTIKHIRDRIGGTSITISHMGKDPERGERGSSGFPAGFDTIIWVEKCVKDEDGVHTLQLFIRKQKDAEDGQRYWFQSKKIDTPDGATSLVLIPINEAEGKKALDGKKSSSLNTEDVIAGLRKLVPHGGSVTTTELIKELVGFTGKAENTIRNALNKYNKQEGDKFFPFVHGKPGDGKWMLPIRYQLPEGLAEQMATWQRPSHESTVAGT